MDATERLDKRDLDPQGHQERTRKGPTYNTGAVAQDAVRAPPPGSSVMVSRAFHFLSPYFRAWPWVRSKELDSLIREVEI